MNSKKPFLDRVVDHVIRKIMDRLGKGVERGGVTFLLV